MHNNTFCPFMDLFEELQFDPTEFLLRETTGNLNSCSFDDFQDLQNKYESLHESYLKEIENSKKVVKCLMKCLKFYSKLCKKHEAQRKVVASLQETLKEKEIFLKESIKNQEKMNGLIEVYKTERTLYSGVSNETFKKDKEILLDVCCRLVKESTRANSIITVTTLLLKKFKKDLNDEKIKMLKEKQAVCKKGPQYTKLKNDLGLQISDFPDVNFEDSSEPEVGDMDKENEFDVKSDTQKEYCPTTGTQNKITNLVNEKKNSEISGIERKQEPEPSFKEKTCNMPSLDVPELPSLLENIVINNCSNLLNNSTGSDSSKLIINENSDKCDVNIAENKNVGKHLQTPKISHTELIPEGKKGSENDCVNNAQEQQNAESVIDNVKSIFEIPSEDDAKTNCASSFDVSVDTPTCVNQNSTWTSLEEDLVVSFKTTEILTNFEEHVEADQEDLTWIFEKMSNVRLLSPIKELCKVKRTKSNQTEFDNDADTRKLEAFSLNEQTEIRKKRSSSETCEGSEKNKKTKITSQALEVKTQKEHSLLDSIMSAMSIQNEEFKSFTSPKLSPVKIELPPPHANMSAKLKQPEDEILDHDTHNLNNCVKEENEVSNKVNSIVHQSPRIKKGLFSNMSEKSKQPEDAILYHDTYNLNNCIKEENEVSNNVNSVVRQSPRIKKEKEVIFEKMVMHEIKNFVSCEISSKEEADKNVKHCVSVLANASEETLARCIVTIVLENIDENVEVFERPAPPLTKTQHRLMVLLSVFKTLNYDYEGICSRIMAIILDKLFPDKFFWPDDCIETATRFYAALCKSHSDFKTIWKFCLRAMTDMKQRSCLVVFTVLKTWPDVLHDASTLRNNILAVTIVNIFLHTPKGEGLQNMNQKKKLMALKHLLMNFYQFKVEDTIETYTSKVLEAFLKGEKGSKKSMMLLVKCRNWNWTKLNILLKLKGVLEKWSGGNLEDSIGYEVLSVVKEVCSVFSRESDIQTTQVKELIPCLSVVLNSGKVSHSSERSIIEILLQMKQHAEARKLIREWVPKGEISNNLRNEIINASAENILRELKLNKRKDSTKKKPQNKFVKKGKGKKKKAKKKNKKKNKGGNTKQISDCDS